MIYVQFKYCTSHNFSQRLLINYQSSKFHCSTAAVRGPGSNVRWQWKPKSSSFFMMLPMWEVLLKSKKLVELVNLGPGFSSVSLPKQISKSCMDQNAYIVTCFFSWVLGDLFVFTQLDHPNDQIPDQEVSAEVLWAPLWLMAGCLAADSVPSFGSKSNSFTCKVNTSSFFIIHTVIAIIITTSWWRNPCH